MKKTIWKALLVGATLLAATAGARADTIRLKSGLVVVGDVRVTESGRIEVTARFPESEVFTFERDELAPRSLYDVLERRTDPGDAEGRRELGELAESLGLWGQAASEYLAVADLRPDLRKEMESRVRRVNEAIAAGILQDARELMDQGNPNGALLHLHTIQERFGGTEAAKQALRLMKTGMERAGASADVARKTVSEEKAPRLIEEIGKDLEKAEAAARELRGHEGDSSRDRKTADRAIRYFERAWEKIKTLPVAARDTDLQVRIAGLRRSVKQRLAQAYLTAGSIHLQQYSIPRAEEYCNQACELMPEDKASHELHRLIIEAKINDRYGWGGR